MHFAKDHIFDMANTLSGTQAPSSELSAVGKGKGGGVALHQQSHPQLRQISNELIAAL